MSSSIQKVEDIVSGVPLEQSKKIIFDRNNFLSKEEKIAYIREIVDKQGYYCDRDFTDDIEGLETIELSYYLCIQSFDKDGHSDTYISGVDPVQDDWVAELLYEYTPERDDYWDAVEDYESDYWEHSSGDSFSYRGRTYITVYHKAIPYPADRTQIKIIGDDGTVCEVEVNDDVIMYKDEVYYVIDDWDCCKPFVVPGSYN